MTTMIRPTRFKLTAAGALAFTFVQTAGQAGAVLVRRVMSIRNRGQVSRLSELDDYLLRDIGIRRCDLVTVSACALKDDPTAILRRLADGQARVNAARRIN